MEDLRRPVQVRMNDDAARREEHIGEHLQMLNWKETTPASPCFLRPFAFISLPQYANCKIALTLLCFDFGPWTDHMKTSRRVRLADILRDAGQTGHGG